MSLAETQQIMAVLQEIMYLLDGVTFKTETITKAAPTIKETEVSLRKQIRTLDTMMMLLQATTGDKTIDKATKKITQFMGLVMRARMLVLSFYAASGPWGWAYFGANVVATAIAGTDFAMS